MQAAIASVCKAAPSSCLPLRVEPQYAPPGVLSPEEAAAVRELRCVIEREMPGGSNAEANAHMDDFTLLRFVKSRPEGVQQAFEMYRDAMTWRVEQGASTLFEELHPNAPSSGRLEVARAHFYAGFGGLAKDGVSAARIYAHPAPPCTGLGRLLVWQVI